MADSKNRIESDSAVSNWSTLAPLNRTRSPIPGGYSVNFRPDHTLEKHLAFIGNTLEQYSLKSYKNEMYSVDNMFDDDLLKTIRQDPGVRSVVEATEGRGDFDTDQGKPGLFD